MKFPKSKIRRKLIVVGQVPPPAHGQAIAIKSMIDGLQGELDLIHVPMRFSETVFENGRMSFHKVTHLMQLVLGTLWLLIRYPGSILYYPPAPASWVPAIRDAVFLSIVRRFAAKTIFHFHAHGIGEFLRASKPRRFMSWIWNRPDMSVVLGESCVDDAILLGSKQVRVIPYGVQLVPAVRRRPKSSKIVVLYVGMLAESKGVFDLLETANELKDLDIEFRLVGTYKYSDTQPRFEEMRRRLNLSVSVIDVGYRCGDELWQEYADADIFFFPTFYETETFGIVLLEAMAHELPVVASRWRGPKDIVRHNETGFLCEPRDIQAFANAIRQLSGNPELREQLGRYGRVLYTQKFTLNVFLDSMKSVFVEAGCRSLKA